MAEVYGTFLNSSNFSGYNGSHFYLELRYEIISQSSETNKSVVRFHEYVGSTDGYSAYGSFASGYVMGEYVGGLSSISANSYNYIGYKEITYTHNVDGTLTVGYNASFNTSWNGVDNASVRGDLILPKINRYVSLISGTNFTDETNPVYSIANPDTTHTVRVKIEAGGDTQLITRDLEVGYSGTYTLELTNAERNTLRALTPSSNTLTVRETVCSMNGNTELNASWKDYTMTIVNANPTYTYTIEEQNANVISVLGTDDASTIIENASQVEIAITPTAYKSATISNVKLTHNNATETKTSSPYVFTKDVKANSFVVTVTDSRTNYFENTITKTIIPYTPVKINSYSLKRQNQTSSNVILNLQATYTQTTFGSTANVPTVKWKLDDGIYTTIPSSAYTIDTTNKTLTISNYTLSNVLPYTSKGYFSIEVSDLLTSNVENDILVIKGIPTFDYGEHDLKVNGDLYVADTDGENAVNVLDEIDNAKIYANTYSTTEIVIGKWINDEPIYRKVYSVDSFPNAGNAWVATGINNIDEVIYCGGFETNENERVFLSSAYNSSNFDCLVYDHVYSGHNNSIRIHTASNRSSYSGYVWIDYTKSS